MNTNLKSCNRDRVYYMNCGRGIFGVMFQSLEEDLKDFELPCMHANRPMMDNYGKGSCETKW